VKRYTCAECGETFDSPRSDEAARAEAEALWGPAGPDIELVVVCEVCFRKLVGEAPDARR
jgi:hypothetical protein